MAARRDLYLIDTSVWVLVLRRRPPPQLAERVRSLIDADAAAFNEMVRLEILVGCRERREFEMMASLLEGLVRLPIGEATWGRAAELGFDLRRRGVIASTPDLIIAASALEGEAVLLHADSDFDRIAAPSGLRVESYVER